MTTVNQATSYITDAASMLPNMSIVTSNTYLKSVSRYLGGFLAPKTLPRTYTEKETVPVAANEPQNLHRRDVARAKIPTPLPGLISDRRGPQPRKSFLSSAEAKLLAAQYQMEQHHKRWVADQQREAENEERAHEYRNLAKLAAASRAQDEDEDRWTFAEVRGVGRTPYNQRAVTSRLAQRPGENAFHHSGSTLRLQQGLDLAELNEQFKRGELPMIFEGMEFPSGNRNLR
jgi:hypothetical protein